jgi:4-diphosphocytidyl-2-C-methyl-D-erythritol kinase
MLFDLFSDASETPPKNTSPEKATQTKNINELDTTDLDELDSIKVLKHSMQGPVYRYRCPAKLNLCLQITGQREDGYHLLQSLFTRIDLYDILMLNQRFDGQITRSHLEDIRYHDDLCIKAAKALKQFALQNLDSDDPELDQKLGVNIQLQKNIPMGAGLGGGSSNAAYVLMALNDIWQLNFSTYDLANIAIQLGADIPFFLNQDAAWVEGIGQKITPIQIPQAYFIIVKPQHNSPTSALFQSASLIRNAKSIDFKSAIKDPRLHLSQSELAQFIKTGNAMQGPFLEIYDDVAQWLTIQQSPDSNIKWQMSGSGSCFFAYFENEHDQEKCFQTLGIPKYWDIFMAKSI